MKKNEVLKPTENPKSKFSRHLMTFVAGANLVLGSFAIPQTTHAGIINEENVGAKKATYAVTLSYEKLDDASLINGDGTNIGSCPNNGSGCNSGCK